MLNKYACVIYLIHLIPRGVKITLDNLTRECFAPDVDLDIGVTLALHHAPHQVILGHQTPGL